MATPETAQVGDQRRKPFDLHVLLGAIPLAVVLCLYAFVESALYGAHVPWRDEGQAWFWARAISTPSEFFIVPGEGHPPVWYWLLRALSVFLTFDQARLITVLASVANAALILMLLRRDLLIAILLVFSAFSLHYWGYNFRPYTLVLSLTLVALWCDRAGKPLLGTWFMTLSCGLHVFSGFLFAFWLTVAWRRGLRFRALLPPALLALFFAVLVVLSGHDNASYQIRFDRILADSATLLGTPFSEEYYPPVVAAGVVVVMATILFWRDRATLLFYLAVSVAFCLLGTVVYGRQDWHLAFLIALLLMAYVTSERPVVRWPMIVLLWPGLFFGLLAASYNISINPRSDQAAYEAIRADAGDRLDPTRNLVSWPDFPLLGLAARHDFRFISGNNGAVVGPVRLADRKDWQVDLDLLKSLPHPYWLYCLSCNEILYAISLSDRTATLLYASDDHAAEPVGAFRVD